MTYAPQSADHRGPKHIAMLADDRRYRNDMIDFRRMFQSKN
jgi:hypothetical protein